MLKFTALTFAIICSQLVNSLPVNSPTELRNNPATSTNIIVVDTIPIDKVTLYDGLISILEIEDISESLNDTLDEIIDKFGYPDDFYNDDDE